MARNTTTQSPNGIVSKLSRIVSVQSTVCLSSRVPTKHRHDLYGWMNRTESRRGITYIVRMFEKLSITVEAFITWKSICREKDTLQISQESTGKYDYPNINISPVWTLWMNDGPRNTSLDI